MERDGFAARRTPILQCHDISLFRFMATAPAGLVGIVGHKPLYVRIVARDDAMTVFK